MWFESDVRYITHRATRLSTVYSPVYNLRFGSAGGKRLCASAPVSDEVDNSVDKSEGSNDDVHQISIGNEFETALDEDVIFQADSVEFILQ